MQALGKDLIFISRILRDGSGTEMITDQKEVAHLENEKFKVNCLSISNATYIASSFNSYIVKLKR